jgi:SOS-response transcriptional repressor LexA
MRAGIAGDVCSRYVPFMHTTPPLSSATLIGPLQAQVQTVLPVIGTRLCAGPPSPTDDLFDDPPDPMTDLSPRSEATFLWSVDGHSMAEAGIWEGDLLVVDCSRTPRDGDVVVAGSNGVFSLKRLNHDTAPSEPDIQGVITWAIHKAKRRARPAASAR